MGAAVRQDFIVALGVKDDLSRVLDAISKRGKKAVDDVDKSVVNVDRDLDKVDKTGVRTTTNLERGFSRVSSLLSRRVVLAVTGVVAAFVGFRAIKRSVVQAREFGVEMAQVAVIAPDAADGVARLREEVLGLAVAQNQSQTALASGLFQTITAGITDQTDATVLLTNATKLARVGNTEVTKTVDVLTTAVNAYKLEADATAGVSDVLFRTVQVGKTNIDELASSIGKILPLANNLGVGFKEVSAAVAALTLQGFSTSEAVTLLGQVFQGLLKESKPIDAIMQTIGKRFDVTSVGAKGLRNTLVDLSEAIENDPVKASEVLGGRLQRLIGFLGLTGQNLVLFDRALAGVGQSAGVVDQKLELIQRSVGEETTSALNGLRVAAVDLGTEILTGFDEGIRSAGGFEEVASDARDVVREIAPYVRDLAKDFVEWFGEVEVGSDGVEKLAKRLNVAVQFGQLFGRVLFEAGSLAASGIEGLLSQVEGFIDYIESLDPAQDRISDLQQGIAADEAAIVETRAKLVETTAALVRQQDALRRNSQFTGVFDVDLADTIDQTKAFLSALERDLEFLETRAEVHRGVLDNLQTVIDKDPTGKAANQFEQAVANIRESAAEALASLAALNDPVKTSADVTVTTSVSGGSGVFAADQREIGEQLRDLASQITSELDKQNAARQRNRLTSEQQLEFDKLILKIDQDAAVTNEQKFDVTRRSNDLLLRGIESKLLELDLNEGQQKLADEALESLRRKLDLETQIAVVKSGQSVYEKERQELLQLMGTEEARLELLRLSTAQRQQDINLLLLQGALSKGEAGDLTRRNAEQARLNEFTIKYGAIVQSVAQTVSSQLVGSLFQVIEGTKGSGAAFREFGRGVIKSLVQMALQAAITTAVVAVLRTVLGDSSAAAQATALTGSTTTAISTGVAIASSNAQNQNTEFAYGGIVSGGVAGLSKGGVVTQPLVTMREAGQNEAIIPLPDGRSVPVDLRGSGGGGGATVNFNFAGPVDRQAADRFFASGPQFAAMVAEAITNSTRAQSAVRRAAGTRGGGR